MRETLGKLHGGVGITLGTTEELLDCEAAWCKRFVARSSSYQIYDKKHNMSLEHDATCLVSKSNVKQKLMLTCKPLVTIQASHMAILRNRGGVFEYKAFRALQLELLMAKLLRGTS